MAVDITPQEQAILDKVEIPPRPKALMTVNDEAKKDEPSFPTIVHAIAEDVSISATVLKVVNSPAFRRPNPISSIDQALNMLGIKRVLSIVNAVSVRGAIKTSVDLEDFWEYCSAVAHGCVLICKQLKMQAYADDAYTLGLFHAAGVPLLMSHFEDYAEFFTDANVCNWNQMINQEMDKFHTTHTTIGALMAQDWSLPESIVDSIYNVHYADGIFASGDLAEETLKLIALLKMARHFATLYQNPNAEDDEWSDLEGQVCEYLGVDDASIDELQEEVLAGLAEEAESQ
ncbi:MAG: HDOD domain-containing protein [Pseudomonadales bacterium]|nr:HDOD domain-containing protein [Pseudomonadales bacterium]